MSDETNRFIDEWGRHVGYCNGCDEEGDLDQGECQFCDDGEMVPYDDDPGDVQ